MNRKKLLLVCITILSIFALSVSVASAATYTKQLSPFVQCRLSTVDLGDRYNPLWTRDRTGPTTVRETRTMSISGTISASGQVNIGAGIVVKVVELSQSMSGTLGFSITGTYTVTVDETTTFPRGYHRFEYGSRLHGTRVDSACRFTIFGWNGSWVNVPPFYYWKPIGDYSRMVY